MHDRSIEQLERACFGGGLPEQAEFHLRLAGLTYQQDNVAESHLKKALVIAPGHAAVLIGLYRYYFYKGRLGEALDVAEVCLMNSAVDNGLAFDWRMVKQGDANFGSYDAILPRFYLFALKAYGYLHMRLGDLEEGRVAVEKLLELDPGNKLGGKVLLEVLERVGQDDDD
jgi:tetratricopeptide (TPR) repeat protein